MRLVWDECGELPAKRYNTRVRLSTDNCDTRAGVCASPGRAKVRHPAARRCERTGRTCQRSRAAAPPVARDWDRQRGGPVRVPVRGEVPLAPAPGCRLRKPVSTAPSKSAGSCPPCPAPVLSLTPAAGRWHSALKQDGAGLYTGHKDLEKRGSFAAVRRRNPWRNLLSLFGVQHTLRVLRSSAVNVEAVWTKAHMNRAPAWR